MSTYTRVFGNQKLIIFDIDGTLIDSIAEHVEVLTRAYQKHGNISQPNKEIIRKNIGKPSHQYAEDVFRDHGNMQPTLKSIQDVLDYHAHELNNATSGIGPSSIIPGVIPLLQKLSNENKTLAILSGNTRKGGETILHNTGLMSYFSLRGYSNDHYQGKKIIQRSQIAIKLFEEAQEKNPQLKPDECLMIGDTIHDIEAAHQAKMNVLAVGTGGVPKDELLHHRPTYYLATLADCLK